MNLIPLHFILKDAGTTVCKKFKMLLKWQIFDSEFSLHEFRWEKGVELDRKKFRKQNTLPDFFFPSWVQNVCAHSHFINRWYKAGELLSLILQETIAFQLCHHLFMLFQLRVVVLHEQTQAVPFLFPCGVDPCRNWPFCILIVFFRLLAGVLKIPRLACIKAALARRTRLRPAWGWVVSGCPGQEAQQQSVFTSYRAAGGGRSGI